MRRIKKVLVIIACFTKAAIVLVAVAWKGSKIKNALSIAALVLQGFGFFFLWVCDGWGEAQWKIILYVSILDHTAVHNTSKWAGPAVD